MKLLVVLTLLFSCQVFGGDMASGKTKSLFVTKAWFKEVPPSSKVSAAFLVIKNNSKEDISLVKAESDSSKVVEIHQTKEVDGIFKMRKVESLLIEAGKSRELKHKADHIMFIGLKKPKKEGEQVALKLTFSNGELLELALPVIKMKHSHGKHHHHH